MQLQLNNVICMDSVGVRQLIRSQMYIWFTVIIHGVGNGWTHNHPTQHWENGTSEFELRNIKKQALASSGMINPYSAARGQSLPVPVCQAWSTPADSPGHSRPHPVCCHATPDSAIPACHYTKSTVEKLEAKAATRNNNNKTADRQINGSFLTPVIHRAKYRTTL